MDEITKQTVREISAEIDKRLTDKIIEKSNAELLKKLLSKAESPTEAFAIAALGTTYKRTGFHFDKRLERVTDSIRYLKKNAALSFTQDETALTHTLVIGDNYPALLNLIVQYQGKIDVIYIDPPYGKDDMGDFAKTNYNNDITRDNLLSMLYPRLQLAKRLLSDTGVIFCSIDDRNQAYVKGLFDEVFGEGNFVSCLVWQKKKGGSQDSQDFAKEHEYILCYKKIDWTINDAKEEQDEDTFNKVVNGKNAKLMKLEKWGIGALKQDAPTLYYPIKDPNGNDFYPIAPNGQDGRWRKKPENLDSEHIVWQKNNKGRLTPYEVMYFDEIKDEPKIIKTRTILTEYGTTTDATKEILSIFNNKKVFEYSKPVELIKNLIKVAATNKDALVLDFFAGSGTTGQAVLELNQEDGGKRKFILCTNNEVSEDEEIDFFTKKGLLPPMPTEKAEKENWDIIHKALRGTKEYKNLADTEEFKALGIAYNVTSKRLKRVMTGNCYDGTNNFKWLEKHKPLGDNLLVLDVAEVSYYERCGNVLNDTSDICTGTAISQAGKQAAKVNSLQEGERLPDKIDETLYGEKKMPLAEKIEWLMNNFENAARSIVDSQTLLPQAASGSLAMTNLSQ